MPAVRYDVIYRSLRQAIEQGEYPYRSQLPSEHQLMKLYDCGRSTVRRAVAELADDGFVQSVHGKGVLVLYQKQEQTQFSIGGVESMKEAAARNGQALRTKVIYFTELVVDKELAARTGFPEGSEIYYTQRVRYLDGEALILDHNYFLKDVVRGLSAKIAEGSVYEYMEQTLGEVIITTRRKYTVERDTELDRQYMDLRGYGSLMVVTNQTFNKDGVMFEYTHSRHRPDRFVFYELAQRKKQ